MGKEVKAESFYVPLDITAAINEHDQLVQTGETCRVEALKNQLAWMRGHVNVWMGWPGDGKALWVNEVIPTPNGFKKMIDIHVGDIVFDENGNQCRVTAETGIQLNKNCYKITFNEGTQVVCCENHLWLTYTNEELRSLHTREGRVLTVKGRDQSYKRLQPKVRTTLEIASSMVGRKGYTNHAIANQKAIFCENKNLLLHPYLLGAWLGDGHSAGPMITNHKLDYGIIQSIIDLGYRVKPYNCTISSDTKVYQIGEYAEIKPILRAYDLLKNKHIPTDFLFSSYDQRLSLLQGLMDTDGYVNSRGYCEYCSISKKLAYDVHALICSLGMRASVNESKAKLYGRIVSDKYRVMFNTTLPIFKLPRKLSRIKPSIRKSQRFRYIVKCEKVESVPVKCIQVDSDSRLFLATRSFIPTHNSTFCDFLTMLKVKYDGWKICVNKPENMDTVMKNGKPEIKANRIYKNLAWTLTGKTWNKNFAIKHKTTAMTFEEEQEALKIVSKHYFVVYPKDRRLSEQMKYYRFMYEMYGIDIFVHDPWNTTIVDSNGVTKDEQLSDAFHQIKEFAMETNSIFNIVAHPKSMDQQRVSKAKNSPFKVVNPYMLLGGSAWDMKMDGQFSVFLPDRHLWPRGSQVELHTYKAKDSEIAGYEWGTVQFDFDKLRRQYFFGNLYPMSGELREDAKKQSEINFSKPFEREVKGGPDDMPF